MNSVEWLVTTLGVWWWIIPAIMLGFVWLCLYLFWKHSQNLKSKNNTQQQPQECGNTSKSCVEEKNNQLGACSSVIDGSGVIPSGSVEDYLPSSSPVVDTHNLKKATCEHTNKDIETDEKRFFCKDCKKWIGDEQ